jgi:hypothetical protein
MSYLHFLLQVLQCVYMVHIMYRLLFGVFYVHLSWLIIRKTEITDFNMFTFLSLSTLCGKLIESFAYCIFPCHSVSVECRVGADHHAFSHIFYVSLY